MSLPFQHPVIIPDCVVTSPAMAEEKLAPALTAPLVAIDFETSGLRPEVHHPVTAAVGWRDQQNSEVIHAWCIPTGHADSEWNGAGWLGDWFKRRGARPVANHNMKFEVRMGKPIGIEFPEDQLHCTQCIAFHAGETRSIKLKDLAHNEYGDPCHEERAVYQLMTYDEHDGRPRYDRVPLVALAPYNCADVRQALIVGAGERDKMPPSTRAVYATDRRLIPALARMEERGLQLDIPFLKERAVELEGKADAALARTRDIVGAPTFNPGSQEELYNALFNVLGLPGRPPGKEMPSFEKAALRVYEHPFCDAVLDWRDVGKDLSTYALSWLALQHEGLLHTNYRITGARTGRLSSEEPNVQNVPPSMRDCVVARDGWDNFHYDYSQIEWRLLAALAGIREAIEGYIAGNFDIHQMTADRMAVPRKKAKNGNFCVIYGGGAARLGDTIGVTVPAAKEFLNLYFQRFPEIRAIRGKLTSDVKRDGYIQNVFGRVNRLPDGAYKALNALIQGTAADIIRRAIVMVDEFIEDYNRKRGERVVNTLATIHDEIGTEVKRVLKGAEKQALVRSISGLMREAAPMALMRGVPIDVDVDWYRHRWSEAAAVRMAA